MGWYTEGGPHSVRQYRTDGILVDVGFGVVVEVVLLVVVVRVVVG